MNGPGPITSQGGSSGNVVGPSSATDGAASVFDGTTGKLLKNSTLLFPDANTAVKRNGTNGQTIVISRTYTNDSNYSQLAIVVTGSTVALTTQEAGTGVGTITSYSVDRVLVCTGGIVCYQGINMPSGGVTFPSGEKIVETVSDTLAIRNAANSDYGTLFTKLPTANPGPGVLWNNLGIPAIGT